MRVLFIGFALPASDFQKLARTDPAMPTQTQRFGWSIIESMQAVGIEVKVVAAAPATDFPHNPNWRFRGYSFRERDASGSVIPFLNLTGAKHLSRYWGSAMAARRTARNTRLDAVVVHGVHSPFIWVGAQLAHRLGIPSVVVLTDPPSLRTPYDGRLAGLLKTIDKALILAGLGRVSGVAALTRALASDFAPGKPVLIFEGIARALPQVERPKASGESRVVYAGSLSARYGLRELTAAVDVSQGSWVLHIYGAGELAEEIHGIAASNPRIVYHGLTDEVGIAAAYAAADLLVNPRPVNQEFVRYSFPSKLVEYLASGRPVMTTRLPTIPSDYLKYLSFCGETAPEIAIAIDSWFEQSPDDRCGPGGAATFILESRGPAALGAQLHEFLRALRKSTVAGP